MKAVIIKTTGEKSVIEFEFGESYHPISDAVGGVIECVGLPDKKADLWCNDNGLAEGLAYNPIASALYLDQWDYPNPIVGDVIITGEADYEGETTGLTDEQVEKFLAYNSAVYTF